MCQKRRVLVVDDECEIRDFISAILRDVGHEVHTAANPDHALAELDETAYDLVVSDFNMPPHITGAEFLQIVKVRFPNMKCILMTGTPLNIVKPLCPSDVLIFTKPVDINALLEAVSKG